MLVEGHLEALHKDLGYPEEITKFDYEKHLSSILNNAVWDIQRGNVLKLGAEKEVTHAMNGWEKLQPQAI